MLQPQSGSPNSTKILGSSTPTSSGQAVRLWIPTCVLAEGRHPYLPSATYTSSEEQVTHEGGAIPFESLDGRTLYYTRSGQDDALIARPTAGGAERVIFRCVDTRSYSVAPHGLFHVDCNPPGSRNASQHLLRYWDAATGQDRPVATFDADGPPA